MKVDRPHMFFKRHYKKVFLYCSFVFLITIAFQAKAQLKATTTRVVDSSDWVMPEDWGERRADTLEISKVEIEGNKRTKEWVILRELYYKVGSKIPASKLDSLLKLESNKLFNTNLFITSDVKYRPENYKKITLKVKVLEKWYLYILPVLDVADRNFNEWWQDRDRDLSRLEYGFNFRKLNFRGRNETLKVDFRWGFNHKIKLGYDIPFINKKRTVGLSTFFEYLTNHNIPYQTIDNKLAFLNTENDVRKRLRWRVALQKRKGYYTSHSLIASFRYEWVADSVKLLNPNYFQGEDQQMRMMSLGYQMIYNFTDNQAYPLKGKYAKVNILKQGLGIFDDVDIWKLNAQYHQYTALSQKWFLANTIATQLSTPTQQPYPLNRGLGYMQDFVRGYDLYVMDGQHYALNRNTLRFKVLDKVWNLDKFIKWEQFNTVPMMILLKGFFDTAYSSNRGISPESNTLQNKWLYGGGVGLDIFSFYNSAIKIEYSMNAERETGLFFYYNVTL